MISKGRNHAGFLDHYEIKMKLDNNNKKNQKMFEN